MYDKDLYNLKMQSLRFYDYKGDAISYSNPDDVIECFEKNGEKFRCDEIVVVGGQIGNIERVNMESGIVALGLSYEYEECMKEWHYKSWWSGYRCSFEDIRHATDEEAKNYRDFANQTCSRVEADDQAYEERRVGLIDW